MKTHFPINFERMNHPGDVSGFLKGLHQGVQQGYQQFKLSFRNLGASYPNAVVPIAGIINYLKREGFDFEYDTMPEYLSKVGFSMPFLVNEEQDNLLRAPFNCIWVFHDSSEINRLVDVYIQELSKLIVCEDGVLQGLEWCLNEVMDNVLQHSGVNEGFVMGQVHKGPQHVAFCVFDPGQGIFNSLKNSVHRPTRALDAITLSIKEGVTRDKKIGQGNGMWGLHNIVRSNSGVLAITSHGASYSLKEGSQKTYFDLPFYSGDRGFTIVDFQLNFSKPISIVEALGGYKPTNLRVEKLETDQGNIHFKLVDKASGTGTRQSGQRIRNELLNIYKETGRAIEINFDGIAVVSSSFADELIGKLVAEVGFARFNQSFRLHNMNEFVQPIVDRAVFQRMAELYTRSE